MKTKHIIIFFGLLIFAIHTTKGQSVDQALLFSQIQSASTARAAGVGGSMGALGGDFSAVNTNPAGLAIYNHHVWMVTPSLDFRNTENQLTGTVNEKTINERNGFSLSNLGMAFVDKNREGLSTLVFGLGVNRVANFRNSSSMGGRSTGSMTSKFLELATLDNRAIPIQRLDDYLAGLAFDVSAIYGYLDDDEVLQYGTDYELNPTGFTRKRHRLNQDGGIREVSVSLASNFTYKWLIGASFNASFLHYEHGSYYSESDDYDEIDFFDFLEVTDTVFVTGHSFSFKLGTIYRVTPSFRVGASLHTPLRFKLRDVYDSTVRYAYTFDGESYDDTSIPSQIRKIRYQFTVPWRFIGSAGLRIKRRAAITAEIEYTRHGSSRYKYLDPTREGYTSNDLTSNAAIENPRMASVNEDISNQLKSALRLRLGGELIIKSIALRVGYNRRGNTKKDIDESFEQLSAGIGYGNGKRYLDIAFIQTKYNSTTSPYYLKNNFSPQATSSLFTSNQAMITYRRKF